MKKLLLFLSFLLFNSFLAVAAEEPNPVLDGDGEEVHNGVEYYILSIKEDGYGAFLTYRHREGNESCPLVVAQAESFEGYPVIFRPVHTGDNVVRVSTDLNIKFTEEPFDIGCNDTDVWTLDYDEQLGHNFILTNGVEGNPGCEIMPTWFQLKELSPTRYKIVFCPTVDNPALQVTCRDVGVVVGKDGIRRLALSDVPLTVLFVPKSTNNLKSVPSKFPSVRFK